MPRLAVPLTDTKIKEAKPKEKVFKLSDDGGLQLWGEAKREKGVAL